MKALPKGRRVEQLRQWLAQTLPPHAIKLTLDLDGDGEGITRLCSWMREDLATNFADDLAQEIDALLSNTANELCQRVTGQLVWWTAAEAKWSQNPVRVDPADSAERFDGSNKGQVVQIQKHIEARELAWHERERNANAMLESLFGRYEKVTSMLTDLLTAHVGRNTELEREMARIRDENAALAAELEQTRTIAENLAETTEQTAEALEQSKRESGDDKQVLALITDAFMKKKDSA